MRTDQEQYQKWRGWIAIVLDDIQTVYFHRSMYDGLRELIGKYEERDKECLFFAFLQNVFVDSLAMGIRRQIKCDRNSVSLARLLRELMISPQLVTRDGYYALCRTLDPSVPFYAVARDFSLFGETDATYIDARWVEKDLSKLRSICDPAIHLADRYIAHKDKRGLEKDVTLEELIAALDVLGNVAKKYYLLFTATDMELYLQPQVLPWPRPWVDLYYKQGSSQGGGPRE
jgi:hypothetical protein